MDKATGFEYLDHTADVWVHAWGPTIENAIEQTALALMDTMIASKNIDPSMQKTIVLKEYNIGSLLVAFLSEFLYLFDIEGWIFNKIRVEKLTKLDSEELEIHATIYGEKFDISRHDPDVEVKAITYSYLEIITKEEKSEIKIVFDI